MRRNLRSRIVLPKRKAKHNCLLVKNQTLKVQRFELQTPKQNKTLDYQINQGTDIHAYTIQFQTILDEVQETLKHYDLCIHDEEFEELISVMKNKYGNKPAFNNIQRSYSNGRIIDPQLPGLNIALLLKVLWLLLCEVNDESIYAHFQETLDMIGETCIQGVSHRLCYDYIVLKRDLESKIKN